MKWLTAGHCERLKRLMMIAVKIGEVAEVGITQLLTKLVAGGVVLRLVKTRDKDNDIAIEVALRA